MSTTPTSPEAVGGFLGFIERLGNKLPDPVFLFLSATALIIVLSGIGSALNWSVQPLQPRVATETVVLADGTSQTRPRTTESGRPVLELVEVGTPVRPRNLMTGEGVYWLVSNLIRNFLNFPPLGVVVVVMFGIGVAEKFGLFVAAMKWVATLVPSALLTPTVVFLGIMSHIASDAGYIVLPPLAAGLFAVFGRPPLAGIAAAFAGVAGGFSANLLVSSTDTLVSGITEVGARTLDRGYTVLPTCNWYFMAASTAVLTLCGWAVTSWIVEPRMAALASRSARDPGPAEKTLSPEEKRGLKIAGVTAAVVITVVGLALFVPGAPLSGSMPAPAPAFGPIPSALSPAPGRIVESRPPVREGSLLSGAVQIEPGYVVEAQGQDASGVPIRGRFEIDAPAVLTGSLERPPASQPRWSQSIVPIILIVFLLPGIAYGIATGVVKSAVDVTKAFVHSMAVMAPVIAMAFFAAQFIESFRYSRLDQMLAYLGGEALAATDLPPVALLIGIILITIIVDLLMASMSAKWTMLAPIIVPMTMMVGLSPELTQCAYRVGDSVANIVTPLNSYAIIIIAVMQRYRSDAGMGNMIAMMLPYSIVFTIIWTAFLLLYVSLGLPLGPSAPLWYAPGN